MSVPPAPGDDSDDDDSDWSDDGDSDRSDDGRGDDPDGGDGSNGGDSSNGGDRTAGDRADDDGEPVNDPRGDGDDREWEISLEDLEDDGRPERPAIDPGSPSLENAAFVAVGVLLTLYVLFGGL